MKQTNKKPNKKFEKQIKKRLITIFLMFVFFAITLIFAYPILDSGISRSLDEDQLPAYTYNFTQNVTGLITGNLVFSIEAINSSLQNSEDPDDYAWIIINSSTGVMTLNSTRDNETGVFNISIKVIDSLNEGTIVSSKFNVSPVNDAPVFSNLENQTFNASEVFNYLVNVIDEENNIPYVLNINFTNCTVAEWSTRNCSNSSGKELFNSSYYHFNSNSGLLNISFIPQKNDVGSYVINFSVMDNSALGNKTTNQLINFTVLNSNDAPYFRYVCDNERNATEDSEFTCWINVSDADESYNLTFTTNYSWFTFYNNANLVTSLTVNCNGSTDYNASAMVNFTPTDVHVGNWSINLTITDVGTGIYTPKLNFTTFWFFINNTEDSVSLDAISDITIYEDQIFYVNATDDDLLVTQKNVKNEVLTFKSNTSWVNISTYSILSNNVMAKININFHAASVGDHTIRINVTDTSGHTAERFFIITIEANDAVQWNSSMDNAFIIYEGNLTYFNFTQNVTDPNGDSITFSFTNDSAFQSFDINLTTGVINFTPIDEDVGYHNIIINASDGKQNSLKSFNFTVYNINDDPIILSLATSKVINASVFANSNISVVEDNLTTITLWIQDNDVRILSRQKSYYNETFNVDVTIRGANSSLFSFVPGNSWVDTSFTNRTEYQAVFIPGKLDVGDYNITINVTDASNSSTSLEFNLSIALKEHSPVLMDFTNQTSSMNRLFYYRINATDVEDGNSSLISGNTNFTFSYEFASGVNFLNASNFNTTTGEINITFNSSQGGKYNINITVNDSTARQDSDNFWIDVYDTINITYPPSNAVFNLAENTAANLTFSVNHSVGDNLTIQIYIKNINSSDVLKYNLSYYGNNTNLTWQFTPNFTEETYGVKNLTLIVLNPTYPDINTSSVFNITINHTNAPVEFSGHIGDSQVDYNNVVTINLSTYFSDVDYSDVNYNQTISFNVSSNSSSSSITKTFSNWTLTLSSSSAVTELLNITGIDANSTNSTSNNFKITFTTPTTTPTPTPSSGGGGGGGGGSGSNPVAFKIIAPGKISAYAFQKIIIPLVLENKGNRDFNRMSIIATAFKGGDLQNKVTTSLDKDYLNSLKVGMSEDFVLTVFFDTNVSGDYEILLNATSESPRYTDWTKIYIGLQAVNESQVRELLVFTEEFIAENPQCIEITETINEANAYFEKGDLVNAKQKAEQAIKSCRESISQAGLASFRFKSPLIKDGYLILATLSSMFMGVSYYFIKRRKFKKMIGSVKIKDNKDFLK